MKKIKVLLALLLVVAVAYVGVAWYSGIKVQERQDYRLTQFSGWLQTHMPEVKVVEKSYERSLFSAQSSFTLEFNVPPSALAVRGFCQVVGNKVINRILALKEMDGGNTSAAEILAYCDALTNDGSYPPSVQDQAPVHLRIIVNNQATHGPWLGSQFGVAKVHTQLVVESDDIPAELKSYIESLQIDTVRHYSRDYDMYIVGQPLAKSNEAGSVQFDGFTLNLATKDGRLSSDSVLNFPKLNISMGTGPSNDAMHVVIENLGITTNGRSLESGWAWLTTGNSEITLSKAELTSDDAPSKWMRCENVLLASQTGSQGKRYSESIQGALTCGSNHFEAPLKLKFDMNMALSNIHTMVVADTLDELLVIAENAKGNSLSRAVNRALMKEVMALLSRQVPEFMSHEPSYRFELNTHLNGRQIVHGLVEVKALPISEEEKGMLLYILVPSKLYAVASYAIDAQAMEKGFPEYDVPPLIVMLALGGNDNYFVKNGNQYKVELVFDKGSVKINGEKLSLF